MNEVSNGMTLSTVNEPSVLGLPANETPVSEVPVTKITTPGRSVGQVLNCLSRDIGTLYGYARRRMSETLESSQLRPLTHRVHAYVMEHANFFFWASAALNILTSPLCFTMGMIGGVGLQIGYRLNYCKFHIKVISSEGHKTDYALLSILSKIFFKTILSGTVSGFVLGNYFGNYGLRHDIIPKLQILKERLSDVPSKLTDLANEIAAESSLED